MLWKRTEVTFIEKITDYTPIDEFLAGCGNWVGDGSGGVAGL
jgi:hypothetical protein